MKFNEDVKVHFNKIKLDEISKNLYNNEMSILDNYFIVNQEKKPRNTTKIEVMQTLIKDDFHKREIVNNVNILNNIGYREKKIFRKSK